MRFSCYHHLKSQFAKARPKAIYKRRVGIHFCVKMRMSVASENPKRRRLLARMAFRRGVCICAAQSVHGSRRPGVLANNIYAAQKSCQLFLNEKAARGQMQRPLAYQAIARALKGKIASTEVSSGG